MPYGNRVLANLQSGPSSRSASGHRAAKDRFVFESRPTLPRRSGGDVLEANIHCELSAMKEPSRHLELKVSNVAETCRSPCRVGWREADPQRSRALSDSTPTCRLGFLFCARSPQWASAWTKVVPHTPYDWDKGEQRADRHRAGGDVEYLLAGGYASLSALLCPVVLVPGRSGSECPDAHTRRPAGFSLNQWRVDMELTPAPECQRSIAVR